MFNKKIVSTFMLLGLAVTNSAMAQDSSEDVNTYCSSLRDRAISEYEQMKRKVGEMGDRQVESHVSTIERLRDHLNDEEIASLRSVLSMRRRGANNTSDNFRSTREQGEAAIAALNRIANRASTIDCFGIGLFYRPRTHQVSESRQPNRRRDVSLLNEGAFYNCNRPHKNSPSLPRRVTEVSIDWSQNNPQIKICSYINALNDASGMISRLAFNRRNVGLNDAYVCTYTGLFGGDIVGENMAEATNNNLTNQIIYNNRTQQTYNLTEEQYISFYYARNADAAVGCTNGGVAVPAPAQPSQQWSPSDMNTGGAGDAGPSEATGGSNVIIDEH